MSALKRVRLEEDNIWYQNASVIRHLYQEERKTLKEVKAIMENDKGFPVRPLSTWETKLKQLRMQKKVKARHWQLIYQHVRPRLEYEGKKNLNKPTTILVNGTKKSWDDCWKEFRRNKTLIQGPHQGPLPPLPPGVVIRTPSPDIINTTVRKQSANSVQRRILQTFQTALVSFQPLFGLHSESNTEASNALEYPDSVYRLCLESIPFTRLLDKISDIMPRDLPHPLILGRLGDGQISSMFSPSKQATSWTLQLNGIIPQLIPWTESLSPNGQEMTLNFDSFYYFFMVIYLLSNSHFNLYRGEEDDLSLIVMLEMTFRFTSRRVLLTLLQSRLPSIKSAWEQLLLGAGNFKDRGTFRDLLRVGIDNDWLDERARGHEHLYHAVRNNCVDLVDTLLARGCRADSSCGPLQRESAVMAALENGDLDCAKILIQHCDVNHEFEFPLWEGLSTNFVTFITRFDGTKMDHQLCLGVFLEQGANVDYEFGPETAKEDITGYWSRPNAHELIGCWSFSILDYVFYFHHSVFSNLAAFSKAPSIFSRARALWCLEQGVHVLREYLQETLAFIRPWERCLGQCGNSAYVSELKNNFLNVLLAEQFLLGTYRSDRKVCWITVHGLLELGAHLSSLSTLEGLGADVLYATACLITSEERSDKEHGLERLQWLLNQGFQVDSDALLAATEHQGVTLLECLANHCSDLKKDGAKSLVVAASRNNFAATRLLLDGGVDPNSTVSLTYGETSVFAAAAIESTLAMTKYLVKRGAKPRKWKKCGHPSDFLVDMIAFGPDTNDLFTKVQYFIEEHIPITDPSCQSAHLLEACLHSKNTLSDERKRTFEFLLNKGAKLRRGSPLAQWIAAGGGHHLVQEMLDAGADPNAYSFETSHAILFDGYISQTPLQAAAGIGDYTLVCSLLERGADLNRPALGWGGRTALQAICAWDPVRPEERIRKDKTIKLLLDKGADVNAANSTGHTALIHAARLGDLATAFILLKHGAKINPISTLNYWGLRQTALDVAAWNGRLDMVEFLLNANGLSSSACSPGEDYDEAIQQARRAGHFVVAEMIHKHWADRKREWVVSHKGVADTRASEVHAP